MLVAAFDAKKFNDTELFKPMVLNLSWFMAPFQRLSTLVAPCSSIKIPSFFLGFAVSRQIFSKDVCLWPQRTALWPPRGPRAPVEKPWFKSYLAGRNRIINCHRQINRKHHS